MSYQRGYVLCIFIILICIYDGTENKKGYGAINKTNIWAMKIILLCLLSVVVFGEKKTK